jgi:hypothetical protein
LKYLNNLNHLGKYIVNIIKNIMEISCQPDIYQPTCKNNTYVDCMPFTFQHNIRCPCTPKITQVYKTSTAFKLHQKTTRHSNWLNRLNEDRANYYIQTIKLTEIKDSQQKIISQLEVKCSQLQLKISQLENKLKKLD